MTWLTPAKFGIFRAECGKIPAAVNAVPLSAGRFCAGITMIEPDELPEVDAPQVTNIAHADVGSVRAELVRMHQADAETVAAGEVEIQDGTAGFIQAEHVNARDSILANVNAGEALLQDSLTGIIRAGNASVNGHTGAIVAGSVEVRNSMVGYVAGTDVHVEGSRTGILIARTVTGNVTTLMDTRRALIAGLVGGLFAGIMLLLGRMLFGRK